MCKFVSEYTYFLYLFHFWPDLPDMLKNDKIDKKRAWSLLSRKPYNIENDQNMSWYQINTWQKIVIRLKSGRKELIHKFVWMITLGTQSEAWFTPVTQTQEKDCVNTFDASISLTQEISKYLRLRLRNIFVVWTQKTQVKRTRNNKRKVRNIIKVLKTQFFEENLVENSCSSFICFDMIKSVKNWWTTF